MKYLFLFITFFILLGACRHAKNVGNAKPISHQVFDSLLQKHVNEDGFVNYKGFIKDSIEFNQYLSLLSNNHPADKWSREQQLAYWINAYNAFTIQLIIENYPTNSIKDIKSGIPFVNSVWDIKFINIAGQEYDLNNIEHNILRKMNEPRIHFAIVCASFSCPQLLDRAFTAEKLEQQLESQAKVFFADKRKNIITKDNIQISKILSWFKGDFNNKMSIQEYVNQFTEIDIDKNAEIEYLDYDWSLNEQD